MFVTTLFEIHSHACFCFCFCFCIFFPWDDLTLPDISEARSGIQISSASSSGKSKRGTQELLNGFLFPFYIFHICCFFFSTNVTHQINVCCKGSLLLFFFLFYPGVIFRFLFFLGISKMGFGCVTFFFLSFLVCSYFSRNGFPLHSDVWRQLFKYLKLFETKELLNIIIQ